jgi:type 1 glutamine amidotransferase
MKNKSIIFCITAILLSTTAVADEFSIVYKGKDGIGKGKHIVYIASDHEYRGEQTLPALARIMAKDYGFKCTVIFGVDPKTGDIKPGSSHLGGLEILKDADLMVLAMRFINMADDEMQHFVDYVDRGGPIIGLRTSTHAFNIPKDRKFAHYSHAYPGSEFRKGFGRQVLGETWVTHYGDNHRQSSILAVEQPNKDHPILKGVKDMHTQAGGYTAYPPDDVTVLARGIILNGMTKDSSVDTSKELMPVVWTRERKSTSGNVARILATTQGASEDIISDGFRRLLLNAHLWCLGMEDDIKKDNPIGFVGPYTPTTFSFTEFPRGVKPKDLQPWDSPIMPDAPLTVEK